MDREKGSRMRRTTQPIKRVARSGRARRRRRDVEERRFLLGGWGFGRGGEVEEERRGSCISSSVVEDWDWDWDWDWNWNCDWGCNEPLVKTRAMIDMQMINNENPKINETSMRKAKRVT